MNNKGFTLIELITTFALSSIIIIILINLVIIIKENYTKIDVKSNLIIEQSNLSNIINSKFNKLELISYEACFDTDFCYIFHFEENENSKLVVGTDYITFDNYTYKMFEGSTIEVNHPEIINVETSTDEVDNSFFVIKISITNSLYNNQNFGINFVYSYNSNLKEL